PAVCQTVADVGEDVGHRERDAKRVSQRRRRSGVAAAEYSKRQPADRSGDTPAVVLKLGERGVAGAAYVGLAAIDELTEGAKRDREPGGGVPQRHQHEVGASTPVALRRPAVQRTDAGAGALQRGDLLLGWHRAVPDVIDPARECVYGRQRSPLVARQQRDAVGKVLGLLAGDPLALAVGSAEATGRGLIMVHEAHLPRAKAVASSITVRALPGRGVAASTS